MTLIPKKIIFFNLFFILLFFNELQQVSLLQCKGEQNQDVDWYVLYKLPKITSSNNALIKEGVAYLYMDSDNFSNGWTLSDKDIRSEKSIPGYTLAPIYADKSAKDLLWLLYNDQPPNEPAKLYNGHSKGAIIVNDNKGFWLIHSVPHYPPPPNSGEESSRQKIDKHVNETEDERSKKTTIGSYDYPASGKVNGQSFLCISTNEAHFNTIGKQLMYNQIIVYKKNLPGALSNKFTVLTDAANEKKIKKGPYNNKVNLNSLSGMEFTSFAKSAKWQKDLYDDFVAPQLNTNLYAETWLNGRGRLPSECNESSVMNIESVYLSTVGAEFKSSHDHSKWAVSADGKKKGFWVCVGDINRAITQFERGGGTVCFNLPEVWKNYKNSVKDVEPCPRKKGYFSRIRSWFGAMFA